MPSVEITAAGEVNCLASLVLQCPYHAVNVSVVFSTEEARN